MLIDRLCALQWTAYLLDLVVVLFVVGFTFVCAKKGFIECFFGFISTIVAVVIAFSFAKLFVNITDGLFGLQGAFEKGLTKVFSKISGFDTDVSSVGVADAIKEKDLPVILVSLIMKVFGSGELEAGTTLGHMLGVSVAKYAVTLLCGILLFIGVKLVIFLLKKTLSKIVENIKPLGSLDALLGAVVGLVESTLIVCAMLSLLTIVPSQSVSNYLNNSLFVGKLYNYNPLVHILALLL